MPVGPSNVTRGRTKSEIKNISYEWTIKNFSLHCKLNTKLKSPPFSEDVNKKVRWCLELHPEGIDNEIPEECKSDDAYKRLFKNSTFSDVTISVDGREIQAHKCTLAEQSRVFSAMFETDMTEKRTSNVNTEDMDHKTIKEMPRFTHTGKAENVGITTDLLKQTSTNWSNQKYNARKHREEIYTIVLAAVLEAHFTEPMFSDSISLISLFKKEQSANALVKG
ncbi:hypothetical protein DBV15_02707 [Temnothorax longispinosus]|uniref:BTB domain-containing protein n=1 Tax=Temnothorax longispinosus TaxID=300112 RepID=A0A4S2K971_9HYME|nr:hypothetical protein DBV15_02707 [Temnothorax longispinosus]